MGNYGKINRPDIEDLMVFSVSDIQRELGRIGHSLSSLESLLSRGGVASGQMEWNRGDQKVGSMGYNLSVDDTGLYVELVYRYNGESMETDYKQRYYLQKRESNLIKGSSRYLFLDPYGEGDSLCSKLYFISIGTLVGFYPRSVLSSYGVCYRQQRESHIGRYVWSMNEKYHRNKYKSLKHRKTHYRGKITPFWSRYQYIQEETNKRVIWYLIKSHMMDYKELSSPDIQSMRESV